MPIRADQLQEKKDYQNLILEELRDRNGYVIRNAQTNWDADFAMDKGLLFQFLNTTQPEKMEKLHKFYADKTEKMVINYINREITKDRSSLIYVLKNGVEFDNGVTLDLMYRRPATAFNEKLTWQYEQNILSVMEEVNHKEGERISVRTISEKFATLDQLGYLAFEFLDGKLIRPEAVKVIQMKATTPTA